MLEKRVIAPLVSERRGQGRFAGLSGAEQGHRRKGLQGIRQPGCSESRPV
jgi:hypothetical protein